MFQPYSQIIITNFHTIQPKRNAYDDIIIMNFSISIEKIYALESSVSASNSC